MPTGFQKHGRVQQNRVRLSGRPRGLNLLRQNLTNLRMNNPFQIGPGLLRVAAAAEDASGQFRSNHISLLVENGITETLMQTVLDGGIQQCIVPRPVSIDHGNRFPSITAPRRQFPSDGALSRTDPSDDANDRNVTVRGHWITGIGRSGRYDWYRGLR